MPACPGRPASRAKMSLLFLLLFGAISCISCSCLRRNSWCDGISNGSGKTGFLVCLIDT